MLANAIPGICDEKVGQLGDRLTGTNPHNVDSA
jgi:hypothetical protein